jgi:hypothetical protein
MAKTKVLLSNIEHTVHRKIDGKPHNFVFFKAEQDHDITLPCIVLEPLATNLLNTFPNKYMDVTNDYNDLAKVIKVRSKALEKQQAIKLEQARVEAEEKVQEEAKILEASAEEINNTIIVEPEKEEEFEIEKTQFPKTELSDMLNDQLIHLYKLNGGTEPVYPTMKKEILVQLVLDAQDS